MRGGMVCVLGREDRLKDGGNKGVAEEGMRAQHERTSSKWWLHCICMSDPHPHLHHYHQQKQPYSQFAPASGMLIKDPGQLTGPLPNRFLSTAAGFDSP
ncbi:hypothetical protein JOQ06_005543 [Pogonophryne albipinna]|uniref:Uncharacterized protein n=1 Tax=Pogonophryne albipinna TaxID=1090488 RepID=A0AAD6BFI5_9TELE|nr:hypothetical protein JOQ06_005543 [Pogonophryne albipinna]